MTGYATHPDGIQVLQAPDELAAVTALYKERQPRRVLEIGTWQGGTLHTWLTAHTPDVVVAIDLEHTHAHFYNEWRHPQTILAAISGPSQDEDVRQLVGDRTFDWIFIDGDHDENAVRDDVDWCHSLVTLGGLLLLHDIEPGFQQPAPTGPRCVLEAYRYAGQEIAEFIQRPYPHPWKHGIGVIHF